MTDAPADAAAPATPTDATSPAKKSLCDRLGVYGLIAAAIGLVVAGAAVFLVVRNNVPGAGDHPWLIAFFVIAVIAIVALVVVRCSCPELGTARPRPGPSRFTDQEQRIFLATRKIVLGPSIAGAFGILGIILWCAGSGDDGTFPGAAEFLQLAGQLLLVGCAATGAGAALGFLFAVPRTIEAANRAALAGQTSQDSTAIATQASLAANTNLERVSDWLTTLLVGATLVELKNIGGFLYTVAEKLVAHEDEGVIIAVMIYGFILGFLGVYLVTRLYLTYALRETLSSLTGVTSTEPPPLIPTLVDHALAVRSESAVNTAMDALKRDGPGSMAKPPAQAKLARLYGLKVKLTPASAAELRPKIIDALREAAKDPSQKPDLIRHLDATEQTLPAADKDLASLDKDAEARTILGLAAAPAQGGGAPGAP